MEPFASVCFQQRNKAKGSGMDNVYPRIDALKAALIDSDAVFSNSHDGIIVMNSSSQVVFANDTALEIFGYTKMISLIGCRIEQLMHDQIAKVHAEYVNRHLRGEKTEIMDSLRRISAKRADGEIFPIDIHVFYVSIEGERHYVAFIRDMSDIAEKEHQLQKIAFFDDLTGLPNASNFRRFLESIYEPDEPISHLIAIMGIDHMRKVNATFGFEAGDELLKTIAGRLSAELSDATFFGRILGDQFVSVFEIEKDESVLTKCDKVFRRVSDLVSSPVLTRDARIAASLSMGAVAIPKLASTPGLAFKHAEMAYGDAKLNYRKNFRLLNQSKLEELTFSASLTQKLSDAIQESEFYVVVQPKIDVRSAQCSGGEVLVRWRDTEGNFIRPDLFIPVAEDSGLIDAIGRFVFLESMSLISSLQSDRPKLSSVAVNVSPHQLIDFEFVELVRVTLDKMGVDPNMIEFEITETAVAQNTEAVVAALRELRNLGVGIALDDFGTGQSSLTMLQKLPLDRVKLDRSFVQNIELTDKSFTLVDNTIKMMKSLGYKVTVEGIETREVHDLLYALGVDEAQGYFYSKPLPIDEYSKFQFEL